MLRNSTYGRAQTAGQSKEQLTQQLRLSEAMARCSRTLLNGSLGSETNSAVLNEALAHLVAGSGVARIGLFKALCAPDIGPYSMLIAEASAPHLPSRLAELHDTRIPTTPAIRARQEASEIVSVTLRELGYSDADLAQLDVGSLLICPIQIDGEYWGNLSYGATESERQWTQHEILLLQTAAEMFARTLHNWQAQSELALRTAQLAERAQQVAVLEERQRLSRDLHDSVAQSLYSLVLLADGGRRLARAGRLHDAEPYLGELGAIALQSLKELRLLVYELRASTLGNRDLITALRQRLNAVENRAGVIAQLLVEDAVTFSDAEQEAIWGIAQEALNNALKYADARTVTVRLWAKAHNRGVEICDDGVGFAINTALGGIGLATMQERADTIGGVLAIRSAPGAGATVKVEIPA